MADFDLNLLRTFDALMRHRSVTRAANQLGVTQPAISHALARLRKLLNDPLFIRSPSGLQPTVRSEEIAVGIRRGLHELRDALAPTSFDPATAERHFTLATTSYFNALIVPNLVERVRRDAPRISLRFVSSNDMLAASLDTGEIDLALGAAFALPSRIVAEPFYREKMVWVSAVGNSLYRDSFFPDRLAPEAQIAIHPGRPFDTSETNIGESAPRPAARSDTNRVTVYDSQTAIALVARTDLVACVPKWMAEIAVAERRIVILASMPDNVAFQMVMMWHARRRADQGLIWLRECIRFTRSEYESA
jgi:DNA-binding transcriptional LysR family regulator